MPKAWTHGPTKENWEQQKSAIHRLYIVNDLTLQGVLSELTKLGLNATKPQLEYKLKKWGFKKNLSQDEWRSINRETTKRKFENKETDIIYSGKRLKSGTVEKARQRYGHSNHVVSDNNALVLPQELTICTPPPMSIEFSGWPETLPWLTFVSKQDTCTSKAEPYKSLARMSPTALNPNCSRVVPVQLAAVFTKYMPEMHDGEHVQRAQAILNGQGEAYVLEHLKLIIYNMSNNLPSLGSDPDDFVKDEWDSTMEMLRESSILDIKLNIKTTQDQTLLAFFETLFKLAIPRAKFTKGRSYESAIEVLRWLLHSGIDPNQQIFFGNVPLQYCLDENGEDLKSLRLLLENGANPSLVKLKNQHGGCEYYRKVQLLFEHGAFTDSLDNLLHLALHKRDLDLASRLTSRHNADPASILRSVYPNECTLCEESALCVAARAGMEEVNFVLHHLHLRYPSVPQSTFITPDAYIAAAYLGSEDVTRLFLELNPSALCANCHGITALHVAAARGHYNLCQLLLSRLSGAAFPQRYPTPLHLAIRMDYGEVVQLFIENGADVNSKGVSVIPKYMGQDDKPRTPLQEAMRRLYPSSCISDLLSAGVDYSGVDISTAIESGNEQLISLVLRASLYPGIKDDGSSTLQHILRADHEHAPNQAKLKALAWSVLETEVQLLGGEIVGAIRRGWWDIMASLTANRSLIDTDMFGRTTIEEAIMSVSCPPDFMEHVFMAYQYAYEPKSLCAAVWNKNLPFVKRLLTSRPGNMSPNILESTALGLAAALELSEIVNELLAVLPKASALIPLNPFVGVMRIEDRFTLKNEEGLIFWHWDLGHSLANGSPLAFVALASSPELFNSLLEHGYQSDPLTWLVCAGNKTAEMLELLLNHGQRIPRNNIAFYDKRKRVSNPLSIAISSPMAQQRVKLLLRAGEGMNPSWINDCICYWTPLQQAIKEGKIDVFSELLEAGANINARPGGLGGRTALQVAVENGDMDIINALLKAGADVNARPGGLGGRTALQAAVENGDMDIINSLLKAGADVNGSPGEMHGATALQFAAMNGHMGLAKHLLELGALVNAPRSPEGGRTALEGAAENGRLDMVRFLLEKGALIHNKGRRQYVRAVGFAIDEGHMVVSELLKDHGDWGDSDQKVLKDDYGGFELHDGNCVWDDDIGQMPRTDEDSEKSDLAEETDSSEDAMSASERDGAEFE